MVLLPFVVGAVRVVHPGQHLGPVERVLPLLFSVMVGPSIRSVSVDGHLASCYRSACAEFRHGVNIDAAVLVDKCINRKLVHISLEILVTGKCVAKVLRWLPWVF